MSLSRRPFDDGLWFLPGPRSDLRGFVLGASQCFSCLVSLTTQRYDDAWESERISALREAPFRAKEVRSEEGSKFATLQRSMSILGG